MRVLRKLYINLLQEDSEHLVCDLSHQGVQAPDGKERLIVQVREQRLQRPGTDS